MQLRQTDVKEGTVRRGGGEGVWGVKEWMGPLTYTLIVTFLI